MITLLKNEPKEIVALGKEPTLADLFLRVPDRQLLQAAELALENEQEAPNLNKVYKELAERGMVVILADHHEIMDCKSPAILSVSYLHTDYRVIEFYGRSRESLTSITVKADTIKTWLKKNCTQDRNLFEIQTVEDNRLVAITYNQTSFTNANILVPFFDILWTELCNELSLEKSLTTIAKQSNMKTKIRNVRRSYSSNLRISTDENITKQENSNLPSNLSAEKYKELVDQLKAAGLLL